MKRIQLFAVLFALSFHAFGSDLLEQKSLEKVNGDYIIYHGKENGTNLLYGLLFESSESYLVRRYDMDTREDAIFRVTFRRDGNNLIMQPTDILRGKPSDEEKVAFAHHLVQILYVETFLLDHSKFPRRVTVDLNDTPAAPLSTIDFSYEYWVPAFFPEEFESRDSNTLFRAIYFGKGEISPSQSFYDVTDLPSWIDGPTYKIETKKSKTLNFGSAKAVIDGNWDLGQINNRIALLNTKTKQDAQLYFEDHGRFELGSVGSRGVSLESFPYVSCLNRMYSFGVPVLPETIRLVVKDGSVALEYVTLNPKDHMLTHMVDVIAWDRTGKAYEVFLASYNNLFEDNKSYFHSILTSYIDE